MSPEIGTGISGVIGKSFPALLKLNIFKNVSVTRMKYTFENNYLK